MIEKAQKNSAIAESNKQIQKSMESLDLTNKTQLDLFKKETIKLIQELKIQCQKNEQTITKL